MRAKFIYTDKSYILIEYPTPPRGLSKQINKQFCFPCDVEFQGSPEEVKNKQNLQLWKQTCNGIVR